MGRRTALGRRSGDCMVLVVEDDPALRRSLRRLLEGAGYRVREARDGAEAHAIAELERPDAVVLDLLLPIAGGSELARRLRQSPGLAEIPLVLFSGAEDLEAHARRLGAVRFVRKPGSPGEILDALRCALAEGAGGGGLPRGRL